MHDSPSTISPLPISALLIALACPSLGAQKSLTTQEEPWLRFSGEIQARYEGLEGQFRNSARLDNSDHLGFLRTVLRADATVQNFGLTAEMNDARAFGGGSGSLLDPSVVDEFALLQLFAQYEHEVEGGGTHLLRAGRQTLDYGSRRLIARNRFRQTINNFTGVLWSYQEGEQRTDAFWTMPVQRLPRDTASILDNDYTFDRQDSEQQFLGVFHERPLGDKLRLEAYTYVMLEHSGRKRELFTPGLRFLRKASKGAIHYEWESVAQFGESRQSATGADLEHQAFYQHIGFGYTFDTRCRPELDFGFDYATGDRNPNDGENNRFDRFFGARVQYGMTGIYGAVTHSNMLSPELRLRMKPTTDTWVTLAWRGYWLASRKDVWPGTGIRDASGNAGRHIGQQLEARARWDVLPKSLRFEIGINHLFHGGYQHDAPGGRGQDTTFFYAHMNFWF